MPDSVADRFWRHEGKLRHKMLIGIIAFADFLSTDTTATLNQLHDGGLSQITYTLVINFNLFKESAGCSKKWLSKEGQRRSAKFTEVSVCRVRKRFSLGRDAPLQILLFLLEGSGGLVIA